MTGKRITRRQFIARSAKVAAGAAAFPYFVLPSALGRAGEVAAGNRIVMGAIGVGGQGTGNMQGFMGHKDVRMVAVCDVRAEQRQKAQNIVNAKYGNSDCAAYADFRELLARDDIDAVSIASPDHWHVLHSLQAARAGKDMYTEKPLGVSLHEYQALRQEVRQRGVVFQFGTQQRSMQVYRHAGELAMNGRLGKVHTIRVGSIQSGTSANFAAMPVPETLDYDMWLGPAPWAPYTQRRVYNTGWYSIYDYTLGMLANYGVHDLDSAQWGNGTDGTGPVEIEGTGTLPRDGLSNCIITWNVKMKYANGVTLIYSDENEINKRGVRYEGDEGWVFAGRSVGTGSTYREYIRVESRPESLKSSKIGSGEIHLPHSNDHKRNFLDCVRTRSRTVCPIEAAVSSQILCHLTDIAVRVGGKLQWDPVKEQFINNEEANRMLSRPMRSPWQVC